jgi:hypothetical protein
MSYRIVLFLTFFLLITNCSTGNLIKNKPKINFGNNFSNKGFALIYSNDLYDKGVISKKIDERSLIIFQKKLKINTPVKVTNILNNKSLIARVGKKSNYPSFNNSVLSIRIAAELNLNIEEPYIKIDVIPANSMFVAKRAKTYDEEKNVAIKAPVSDISINNLNGIKKSNKKKPNRKFSYKIKIADFYFKDTAKMMVERIIRDTAIKNPKIKKITEEKYRVYLGPFNNINSLQKSYNDINILEFENIEILKND